MAIGPLPASTGPSLFEQLRRDPDIITLIDNADLAVATLGYTDHGRRHVTLVGVQAARVLSTFGHDSRACDLAAVAGLLHDIGNVRGREAHASAGAEMAYRLLVDRGVPDEDASVVMAAIANHDEVEGGVPVSPPSAALIIADKADIHRSRVRTRQPEAFDIHDRVNYAVVKSRLDVVAEPWRIELMLAADETVATAKEIFELFGERFAMSAAAAQFLGGSYTVEINGSSVR